MKTGRPLKNKIERKSNGCLEFLSVGTGGYARVQFCGLEHWAHRIALGWKLGRLLDSGELACHACDNRACVEPSHLFLGTDKSNSDDMIKKGRSFSKLSQIDVLLMKFMAGCGMLQRDIAQEFGVNRYHAHRVIGGEYQKRFQLCDSST